MPMTAELEASRPRCALLGNYSIEMTARDIGQLEEAADLIPPGTRIPITFLPGETFEMRIAAAKRVRELGFLPIPHISARRLRSQQELEDFLCGLQQEVGTDHAFVVAGDPAAGVQLREGVEEGDHRAGREVPGDAAAVAGHVADRAVGDREVVHVPLRVSLGCPAQRQTITLGYGWRAEVRSGR